MTNAYSCGWCGALFTGGNHYCPKAQFTTSTAPATVNYEAADMVHRNVTKPEPVLTEDQVAGYRAYTAKIAALGVSEKVAVDTLNAENRRLRDELTIATCAAEAANQFYWAEFAGAKTYLTPTETRERFGNAMVAYRAATGADQ